MALTQHLSADAGRTTFIVGEWPVVTILHLSVILLLYYLRDIFALLCLGDMTEYSIKTPKQLGSVLAGYRKERNLTQRAAGEKVGLAQSVVSSLEKSPERAGLARIFKLLAALDLELVVRPREKSARRVDW
jgi:HTH-type transcriptional regulator / antitoxin HipB